MLHAVSSAQIAPGKREEAVEYFKKVASTLRKHGATEAQAIRRETGASNEMGRLLVMTTHDSLEEWAVVARKIREDKEFQALQRDAFSPQTGCLVSGTFARNLFSTL